MAAVPSSGVASATAAISEQITPPRFGRGSRAQRFPWLLPMRSVHNGIAADQAQIGALAIRAASVVGPGHRCELPAVPRQDAYRIARDADSRYAVLAVADGLSSGRFSDIGATAAASATVALLRDGAEKTGSVRGLDPVSVFTEVAERMIGQAADRGFALRDIDAVLVAAVLEAPVVPGASAAAWIAWVGDASAWILRPEAGSWQRAAGDGKDGGDGEFVSNAVAAALPGDPHRARAVRLELPPGAALALVTDGVGDALAGIGDAQRYFATAWRTPPSAVAFVNDVSYDAEQFLDDRTAVVVWNGVPS